MQYFFGKNIAFVENLYSWFEVAPVNTLHIKHLRRHAFFMRPGRAQRIKKTSGQYPFSLHDADSYSNSL